SSSPCSTRTSPGSSTSRTGSATTAATRSTSRRSPSSAGSASAASTRPSPRRSPGTATTSGGGGPSRTGADVRVLVTGAAGQLGQDLVRTCTAAGDDVIACTAAQLDLGDRDSVAQAITGTAPDVVVNAGAWTAVDDCEADPDRAWRINALGVRWVTDAARRVGAHVVHVSTDYVFDGTKDGPYVEWDAPNPQSAYGRSKLGGEREVDPAHTIVR